MILSQQSVLLEGGEGGGSTVILSQESRFGGGAEGGWGSNVILSARLVNV